MIDNKFYLLFENDFNLIFVIIITMIWLIGIIIMLVHGISSYKKINQSTQISINHHDNVYICDDIDTPFIFGFKKPKIYLPSNIDENNLQYILTHEQIHIENKDYLWKPLGYLLLSIYWFNPMIWIGYIQLCKDIESACDENVLEKLGIQTKCEYSEVLLKCSSSSNTLFDCPVAFGEIDIKERIQNILIYNSPKKTINKISIILCAILCVGFLTEPYGLDGVKIEPYSSTTYTKHDIDSAMSALYKNFNFYMQGCTLTEIKYAGDNTSKHYIEWANRYNADEVIVFYITFEVGSFASPALNPNSTYEGFSQILVRKHGGKWHKVDGGYG